MLMLAASEGDYAPPGGKATDIGSIVKECLARSTEADDKLNELCRLCEAQFGESLL
jgi:hypothetical protein